MYSNYLGAFDKRFGRDAPPVEADAAEVFTFYYRNFHAELRGADRRYVSAGAGADYDEVVCHIYSLVWGSLKGAQR